MKINNNVSFGNAVLVKSLNPSLNEQSNAWKAFYYATKVRHSIGLQGTIPVLFPRDPQKVLIVNRKQKKLLTPILYKIDHLSYISDPKPLWDILEKQMNKIVKSKKTKIINFVEKV